MEIFMNELAALVGAERVVDDANLLTEFVDGARPGFSPKAIVRPENAQQVTSIVQWARKTKTPLVCVSSSGPHRKGGVSPEMPGSVMVDLSGMNRIRSINRTFRMAVVEPGVTYEQLQAALDEHGMYLVPPLLPKKGKSVLASVLDLEPRLNPSIQWNYPEPFRCAEVVWGDGQRMGTGEAHGQELEDQLAHEKWQINPRGPAMIDYARLLLASQGTMGISTWASVHCAIKRSRHEIRFVASDGLAPVIDFAYRVTRIRFGDEIFLVNSVMLAAMMADDSTEFERLRAGLPSWIAVVGISAGEVLPEQKFRQQESDLTDIATACGLELVPRIGVVEGERVRQRLYTPDEKGWRNMACGAAKEIFFVTTMDKTPGFVASVHELSKQLRFAAENVGVYIQPQHQGINAHCEFTFFFDPAQPDRKAAAALFEKASERLCIEGAYYSRPYGSWSRLQFNKDAQTTEMLRKLKHIFDPDDILNPGKLGDY